ncbi:MAG: hypoxanthine phosphoribosyltransferase [Planctomycetes bacterium]|nr:hypoxanthine phosphoribosyltransferase [Planctomycetota bacterium]
MSFRILIDETRIRNRIRELAADLRGAYDDPLFVVVLDGARTFAQGLLRALGRAGSDYEPVRVRSYEGTQSTGRHELVRDLNVDVRGRDIVLLEDIVDTGRTVRYLDELLRTRGARSIDVWTLLSKPSRRVVDVELRGVGFEIPDEFVIGYGLDFDGKYRELPHIAIWSADAEAQRLQAGSTLHEGGATSG